MAFNKAMIESSKKFSLSSGNESDPWDLFPTIKIFKNEQHLVRLLVPLSLTLDLWIHNFKTRGRTRTLCVAAHYDQDCEICAMPSGFGDGKCWPKHMRLALAWDYSNIGKTWTPEAGPNAGIPQPILPYGVVSIEKGEGQTNWMALENANAQGFGFPDSPNQSMLWGMQHVEQVGFQPPMPLPDSVLGQTSRVVDPQILNWINSAKEDDIFTQYLATCRGVEWERFGLKQPAPKTNEGQGGQQNVGSGQVGANKRGARGARKPATVGNTPQAQGPQGVANQLAFGGGGVAQANTFGQAPNTFAGGAQGYAPPAPANFAQNPPQVQAPSQGQGFAPPSVQAPASGPIPLGGLAPGGYGPAQQAQGFGGVPVQDSANTPQEIYSPAASQFTQPPNPQLATAQARSNAAVAALAAEQQQTANLQAQIQGAVHEQQMQQPVNTYVPPAFQHPAQQVPAPQPVQQQAPSAEDQIKALQAQLAAVQAQGQIPGPTDPNEYIPPASGRRNLVPG